MNDFTVFIYYITMIVCGLLFAIFLARFLLASTVYRNNAAAKSRWFFYLTLIFLSGFIQMIALLEVTQYRVLGDMGAVLNLTSEWWWWGKDLPFLIVCLVIFLDVLFQRIVLRK